MEQSRYWFEPLELELSVIEVMADLEPALVAQGSGLEAA